FERVRGFLALKELDKEQHVRDAFSCADPSFVRTMQIITDVQMSALQCLQVSQVLSHQAAAASSSGTSRVPKGNPGAQARAPVPQDVQDALPMMNGQSLCMRYISKVPCPSKHDGCFSRKRGHFAPATLPGIVFDFIQKNYGGLRKDCAAISREQSDD
ncbi:hypothetical protein PHMEG_00037418, partial [Phytophthora megakarya]